MRYYIIGKVDGKKVIFDSVDKVIKVPALNSMIVGVDSITDAIKICRRTFINYTEKL